MLKIIIVLVELRLDAIDELFVLLLNLCVASLGSCQAFCQMKEAFNQVLGLFRHLL